MATIQDGTGTGYFGKIGSDNRFWIDAIQRSKAQNASLLGDSYNINTGSLTLTSANKSAVLYLKNNGVNSIVVEKLFYLIGNSTGGSGDMLITVTLNNNAGTIVTDETDCEMAGVNRNAGSPNTLTADIFKGGEAKTVSGGYKVIESIFNQSATRAAIDVGYIILPKGKSLAVEITPATGNTSLAVQFAGAVYERRIT